MTSLRLDHEPGTAPPASPPSGTLVSGLPRWLTDDALVGRLAAERAGTGVDGRGWSGVAHLAELAGTVAYLPWPDPVLGNAALRCATALLHRFPEPARPPRRVLSVDDLPPFTELGPGSRAGHHLLRLARTLAHALATPADPAATAAVLRDLRDALHVYCVVAVGIDPTGQYPAGGAR